MSKEASRKSFEWYAQVALEKLNEIDPDKKMRESFYNCKTRSEFEDFLLNVFIAHYGLRCTCDDCQDWKFQDARGHYHHCQMWHFTHAVGRALDWMEAKNNQLTPEGGRR